MAFDWVAAVAAFGAVASACAAWWVNWRNRTQRVLKKSFTTDLYSMEVIENSTRYYVQPNGSSVDPTQEAEMRHTVAIESKLFEAIDKYLAEDSPLRHLFLLADSGMGKSSFVLNYYARNQHLPKGRRHRIEVIPLGIPDALERIAKVDDKSSMVLFLDAFDEDTQAIADHKARLLKLMDACKDFRRVLITCRTQFFPLDEEIPVRTGIYRFEPRRAGEPAEYEFWKMYLTPFDDRQVKEYLRRRYSLWERNRRKRAYEIVQKIPLLSVRPMLLAHIPDVINSEKEVEYSFQLYETMVESWLERESYWVKNTDALRAFSERLAVDIHTKRQEREAEHIPHTELSPLAKEWNLPDLEDWQLRGRSLLNRDAEGNYKFSHRSIMEYLVVRRLTAGDEACRDIRLTDQMNVFEKEVVQSNIDRINVRQENSQRANLAEAYLRRADLTEVDLTEVDLTEANLAETKLRRADLTEADLTEANLTEADLTEANLTEANLAGANLVGANLVEANLTRVNLAGANLAGANLAGTNLAEANLVGANLVEANLTEANLTEANLTEANLTEANLTGVNLTGVNLTGAYLRRANLTRANLAETDLRGFDLREVNLTEVNFTEYDLTETNLTESRLTRSNLARADLAEADLTRADITGVDLTEANLRGSKLAGSRLTGANLTGANLTGANLTEADLTEADLTEANLTEANLTGMNLTGMNLTDANFRGSNLVRANLRDTNLTRANLTEADLTMAIFTDANLRDANLRDASLRDAVRLTARQLALGKTLCRTRLDPPLLAEIQAKCPHLLEEPKSDE